MPTLTQDTVAPRHTLGTRARVLLTSVFGPFAQDDEFGSRKINPMELYHNQVTRMQGPFSLRMFHRSWGLMMIQSNISAPCTLLDFPVRERFIEELKTHTYDIIGISSIQPNHLKVIEMCRLIRLHQPNAVIVLGGHIANLPNVRERIDADHVVLGDGVSWFRRYLGEDENLPIRHPRIKSGFGAQTMGMTLRDSEPTDVAATLIPSVGCPLGCNFCATSAMFGGKGQFKNFYETGDELFAVMQDLERDMKVRAFFVMDENFLLHRARALRLLELMRHHNKSWSLYVFSSARVLLSYKLEELVGLGVSWVWMGLEGKNSQYGKLDGVNTHELIRTLQSHGIRVLGSTIIGLEEHTPENIEAAIDYAISHDTDFHQFMLYTPLGGTALYKSLKEQGRLLDPDCKNAEDWHGQLKFNYKHPHIRDGQEQGYLLRAFERDFEVNGPSVIRLVRSTLKGYQRYKDHPDERVRNRYKDETREAPVAYAAMLWASARWYRNQPELLKRIVETQKLLYSQFGWRARIAAVLGGPWVYYKLKQMQARIDAGFNYEPMTYYDKTNQHLLASPHTSAVSAGTPVAADVELAPANS